MTTRRGFISMAGGALLAAGLRAETPQERGRKVVNDTIHALGGDGFRFMNTRVEQGRAYSFYREEMNGLSIARFHTKYLPADSKSEVKQVQRQVFGKKEDNWIILKAEEGWEVTFRGARKLPDERIQQYRDSTLRDIFYILRMRVDEPGIIFETRGRDVVENVPVEVLDVVDSENRKLTVYIHSSTLLPVKQSFQRWDKNINDRRDEVTRFTKYRESGNGVMWPYDVQRERDKEKLYELYADKVVIGEDLNPELFELPPGIKIIEKRKR
ncbi:MAG: hypothetical protein JWN34_4344 [Bryobacterales bacterium]|nr:hypothetical protein [Bryobacterales bacterium]